MDSRPTATQRGYGAAHRAERAKWAPRVEAGTVDCAKCGRPLHPDQPWDLGHTDDRSAWTGPEHPRCNRAAGGRSGNRIARERSRMIKRPWK